MTIPAIAIYQWDNGARTAAILDDDAIDIAALTGNEADANFESVIQNLDQVLTRLHDGVSSTIKKFKRAELKLLAPLSQSATIYCAGANYTDHVLEMAKGAPTADPRELGLKSWFFIKSVRCAVGPGAVVTLPRPLPNVDWEAELAVVIGRKTKDVAVEKALDCIAGYMIANDLSARGLSRRAGLPEASPFRLDWLAHKNFDGACPIGPYLTLASTISDPQALEISLSVNGDTKQNSSTGQMIFSVAEQISHLSERMTLYPGDVVLTGTPAGVGAARGEFLQPGDRVSVEVAGLGELVTSFV